jgi:hypothetical protein
VFEMAAEAASKFGRWNESSEDRRAISSWRYRII